MPEVRSLFEHVATFAKARVLVLGDLVLDGYWNVEPDPVERSLETGLWVQRVTDVRSSPGGAGNVAVALRRLGVRDVCVAGVVGDDLFGRELLRQLQREDIETSLTVLRADLPGVCHAKPMRRGVEGERFDFGTTVGIPMDVLERLAEDVVARLDAFDAVILNQQVEGRLVDGPWLQRVVHATHEAGLPVWVDFRHVRDGYVGMQRKLNRAEARRFLERRGRSVPASDRDVVVELAKEATAWSVLTCGGGGMLASDGRKVLEVPGFPLQGSLDPTGAGDTALAVLAAGVASGVPHEDLLRLANLAAAYTVTCLGATGCPDPAALLDFARRMESGT